MEWRAHSLIGFILTAMVASFFLQVTNILFLFVLSTFGMLSALLPDLDQKNSKAKTLLDFSVVIAVSGAMMLNSCGGSLCIPPMNVLPNVLLNALAIFGVYFLIFTFLKPKHRGITHSLVFCLGYTFIIFILLGKLFAAAALVGYLSHLLADKEIKTI